jgi:hypothetical protein
MVELDKITPASGVFSFDAASRRSRKARIDDIDGNDIRCILFIVQPIRDQI